MDGLVIKPRDPMPKLGERRRNQPGPTETAASETVAATQTPPPPTASQVPADLPADAGSHEFHLDAESQMVIDRERDVAAGHSPGVSDQAFLGMRAYSRSLTKDEEPPPPDEHTDLKA
jgi:hypothetical protein